MSDVQRPKEIHIATVSNVERDALPLLCSMVNHEIYTAEMINTRGLGIIPPGIYLGFLPTIKSGLTLRIKRDAEAGIGKAVCKVGMQLIEVLQQHDIDFDLTTGYKWNVVVEPYYEVGGVTNQVDADSVNPPAVIKAVLDTELTEGQQIICNVDLRGGENEITLPMLGLDGRISQSISILNHLEDPEPHPMYLKTDELQQRVEDIIDNRQDEPEISDEYEYDEDGRIIRNILHYPSSTRVVDYVYDGELIDTMTIQHYGTTIKTTYFYTAEGLVDYTEVTIVGSLDGEEVAGVQYTHVNRRVTKAVKQLSGGESVTEYNYVDSRLDTEVNTYKGIVTTRTFTYNEDGTVRKVDTVRS